MLKDKGIFTNTGNKVLLLLVGAPGAGKSTFVNQNGLEDYTISMDKYRLLIGEVKLSLDNYSGEEVAQDYNAKVAEVFWEHLEERMNKGLFTVIDNTNVAEGLYKDYHKLASKYGYTIFFKLFPKDVDTLIQINKKRGSKEVNEAVIKSMVEKYNNISANNFSKIRAYCHQIETIKDLPNYIPYELDDFGDVDAKKHFRRVYFIGDIQGCSQELNTFLQLHYDSDCCYVFTGDLLDRGYDNYGVLDIAYTLLSLGHNNIFFIRGNHDEYIERYLLNGRQPIGRGEFDKNTIPQIVSFPTNKLELIASQFISSITIKWGNSVLFASHGGVNKLRHFISDKQLCKGVGKYEDHQICDENFATFALNSSINNNYNCYYYSIHGHRNSLNVDTHSTTNTFNLEGKVEFGGNLRIVAFNQDNEFECIEIPSINKENSDMQNNDFNIETLSRNNMLNIKELNNELYSVNFTREAFGKKAWDEITLKARGLFIDASGKVFARSYNKFFNIGERPETQLNELPKTLGFPIDVYYKYNGFLGIVGYKDGEVLYCSKTTNEGRFADMVREMLQPYESKMLPYLQEGYSLVFEIMHPSDVHIIDQPFIPILLDIIKNDINHFEKYDYNSLRRTANDIGVAYKEHYGTIVNENELYETIEDLRGYTNEGFVFEGPNGMVKLKTDYYNFWKGVRSDLRLVTKAIKEKLSKNIGRFSHKAVMQMSNKEMADLAASITIEDKYGTPMSKEVVDIVNYMFHYDLDLMEHDNIDFGNLKVIMRLKNLALPYRSMTIPEIAKEYYYHFPQENSLK